MLLTNRCLRNCLSMENSCTGYQKKRDRRFKSKNCFDSKLDLSRKKAVSVRQHEPWHQSLRQDLSTGNQDCLQQESAESSDDAWSDLSFYDLPDTLKDSIHKSVHPAEFTIQSHMVSRPPYHATAEAHRAHTFLDSEVSNPFSLVMGDTSNPTSGCLPSGTAHLNGNQSTEGNATGNSATANEGMQDMVMTSSKPFDGSLYYRQSNAMLNGQQKREIPLNVRQCNGHYEPNYPLSARSSAQVQIKVPPALVSSELPTHKPVITGRNVSGVVLRNRENASHLERLKKSLSSSGSHSMSSSQDALANKFMQRSRELLHKKERRKNDAERKKEHSPKSVSFANSVKGIDMPRKTTLPGRGEERGYLNGSVTPQKPKIQSNVVLSSGLGKSLIGCRLHNSEIKRGFEQKPQQQSSVERESPLEEKDTRFGELSDVPLPPSPPTRDTNGIPDHHDLQQISSSVQVLSLYDEHSLFASDLSRNSGSLPRQSNVRLEFDGNKTLHSSRASSLIPKRDQFLQQSNSVVDMTANRSLRSSVQSRDASLTIEELLSSGSVYSSPESSPPTKIIQPQFDRNSYCSKREHSLDDYVDEKGNVLQDLSLTNSFSVDTSQRISSALWAMKLMEATRSSSPNSYQELLIKGCMFRRWYQKTRLKRLIKQEDEVKLQSAVTFWQTEMQQKCFEAWRNARHAQQEKADKLRRKQMLQKGISALRFAVNQQKQSAVEVQTRNSARIMAKYWLKWQKGVQMKVTTRLKEAFDKWHLFKMDQNRDAMMEVMADRQVLSRNYAKWKIKYETEQKNGVASLHFKIGLLTKSWHSWRLYASQRVVKTRLKDVARVHYEEHLQARLFTVWRENTNKAVVAHSLTSKRILVKAFYCWKNWTQYAKIIRLRFQSMCKEYHRHKLAKQSFHHWKVRVMNRQADRIYRGGLQRKIFKLWFLRYKRKVIHRHLCKALAKKGKKRRFFNRWSTFTKQQTERRRAFVGSLERMLAGTVLNNWRQHVKMKKALRSKELQLLQKKNHLASRKVMDRWLFAMKVVNFRKQARINWSRRCTRKACEAWKILLKRKYLEQRLIDNRSIWQLLTMKRIFKKWRQQKRKVDAENEKAFRARAILTRNFKARVLQAWRVVNQEQQIISPMVGRRERKEMARMFDAWRLHVHRQKNIVDQKTRATEKILDKHFLFWRDQAYLRFKERQAKETLLESKLSRAFTAWRAHVKDQRLNKLKMRARRFELMEKFYSRWKEKVEHRAEEKIEETGKEARGLLLVRWSFKFWRTSADHQRECRLKQQETADNFYKNSITRKAWAVWVRRYRVEGWARDHSLARKEGFLRKIFQAWQRFIKDTLQLEMQQFATSLSGLDSSFGSFSPFRNTLGSTMGSTLGSTLSDALTSSGYGASIRRGSGSVFTFGLPLKERDDDIASLPGRFDQIDHLQRPESLNIRSISPISILRDSRPMSPLVFNSNHSSPATTPYPSPEHHPPSTPPIRLEDFSPVKSEDDTGIHSGSSETDHEDDRMSTASCTSFTGRSTQSEVRDRELMATETILHWRNLPLSLTFRTWLKFTRQRKVQRELLNYITNKKTMELMVNTLATWRRELHTKVTARQHWLHTSRLKCLRTWHEYTVAKRIQEERKLLADEHRRLTRLKGSFQKWNKRCSAKKKLQELIGQWQKKAIVSEKDKSSTQVMQTKQHARFVRQTFSYWLQMTRKSQEAKRLYTERLLPKCFSAWHVLASTRVSNRRKVVLFEERRLLTMAFREWQDRYQAVSRVDEFIEIKEADRLLEILRVWHSWASGMNTRRKQARLFRHSVELKITREIFTEWLSGAQQLQIAKRTHEMHILRSVFVGWKDVALERSRNRRAMHAFRNNAAANLLARNFRFWQQLLAHSEVSRAHSQQRDHNVLRECFEEWRDYTLDVRANKFYVMAMQKKMFLSWYDEYTSRKTTRRLIHTWKSITEEAKVLNTRAMHIAEDSEKKLLRRMFDYWVQETHKVQKAKNYAREKMMRSILVGLHEYVYSRAEKRKVLEEIQQTKSHDLVSKSFQTWKERFQRNMRNQEVLEEHLEKKDSELLHYCLVKWVKFMLRCKAEKSYQKKLVQKCFAKWWFALYTKKGAEKIQEKILVRRTREAALHWKQWTFKVKKQAVMADDLQTQHGRRLLHSYFVQWTVKTRQMQRAKELHNQTILKRSLVEWRKVARKRIDERKKIKSFQDQTMNKKVSRMFYEWRDALKVARKQTQMIDGQMVHHNRRVKQGCLGQWKKFTLKSRADKHCNKTVTAKFFADWKAKTELKQAEKEKAKQQEEIAEQHYHQTLSKMCFRAWLHDVKLELFNKQNEARIVEKHFNMWKKRIDLNSIATEMVDRRVYEKFWTTWRHQLIRKRVSQMMMKHEEKKQLSEVFMAWYQLTLVRRRLLKEWRMYKTKKLFRLWMQKYNES